MWKDVGACAISGDMRMTTICPHPVKREAYGVLTIGRCSDMVGHYVTEMMSQSCASQRAAGMCGRRKEEMRELRTKSRCRDGTL